MKMTKIITVTAALAALGLAGCQSTGGSEEAAADASGVTIFKTANFPEAPKTDFTPTPGEQAPYYGTPVDIPGVVQNENYDFGGQGVSFNELTTDKNGQKGSRKCDRGDGIYLTFRKIQGFKGCVIAWSTENEWVEYTVDVKEAGTYTVNFSVVQGFQEEPRPTFKLQRMDGDTAVDLTTDVSVPFTDFPWADWHTLSYPGVEMTAGVQTLRIAYTSNGGAKTPGNMDYFEFIKE